MAIIIELKLLSNIIISEASFAISVPENIAKPTSDLDKAGASFVPSPVTATTLSNAFNPRTKAYLCMGSDLAITFNLVVIFINRSISLILSCLIFFIGVFVFSAYIFASFSVFGHLHRFESSLQLSQYNPPIIV